MFIFPAHLFNPSDVQAVIGRRTVTGGESLSGDEDVIATDGGGRWEITYSGIDLSTPQLVRAWEAWDSHLASGVGECLVPLVSIETANRPAQGKDLADPSDIYADDELFPETVEYAAPYIIASVSADAPLRATSISIEVSKGARLIGGEKFSVGDRAYKIERETSPGIFKIDPPLREAVSGEASIEIAWPVVKCRLEPSRSIVPSFSQGPFGEAEIRFVEKFN